MVNIKNLLIQTAKFNAVNVVAAFIQIPNQIIIGTFLIPEEYGIVSLLSLWYVYSTLFNPGFLSAGQREIPYFIGRNQENDSRKIQNIAISADLIFSVLPLIVILTSAYFYKDIKISIGLFITALYFIASRFSTYWGWVNFIKQKFSVAAMGKLIEVIIPPLVIFSTIYWGGIYSVLIAPIISSIILFLYYSIKSPINFQLQLDFEEIKRMAKIGILFSAISLIYYGHKIVDNTMIAYFLPYRELGLFAYAMNFVMFGNNFFADFGRVLQPIIWEQTGKVNKDKNTFRGVGNITILLSTIICILIPIIQIGYALMVILFVKKYYDSIPIFIILSNLMYFATMQMLANIILESYVVNKQKYVMFAYFIGLLITIFLDLIMIQNNLGIKYIAMVSVISHMIVTGVLFVKSWNYLNLDKEIKTFLPKIIVPCFISILFTIFHYYMFLIASINILFLSICLQIGVWLAFIRIYHSEYLNKKYIMNLYNEYFPSK